jgi:hypothetical protein
VVEAGERLETISPTCLSLSLSVPAASPTCSHPSRSVRSALTSDPSLGAWPREAWMVWLGTGCDMGPSLPLSSKLASLHLPSTTPADTCALAGAPNIRVPHLA